MRGIGRGGSGFLLLALIATTALLPACGGGGGPSANQPNDNDLVVVKFALVDQVGNPTGATGTQNAYRNNRLTFTFSEKVDPSTISDRTIQIGIPSGTNLFLTANGRFTVDGNKVYFDPTVTVTNAPNPFGFDANSDYTVTVKGLPEPKTVLTVKGKPVLSTFTTTFRTTDQYLPDLDQPRIVNISPPSLDPVPTDRYGPEAQAVWADSRADVVVEFSEAMNPVTFDTATTFRVVNLDRGGREIFGTFRFSDDAKTVTFRPTFGFGRGPYVIQVTLTVDITDLAGNPIGNPQQWVFLTEYDPTAVNEGLIEEYFDDNVHEDTNFSPPGAEGIAAWNPATDPGKLASTFGTNSTTLPNPLQGFGSGNCIPLGSGATWDDYFCQMWYHASLLGNAGTISGYKWFMYSGSNSGLTMTGVTVVIGHSKSIACPFAANNTRTSHFTGTPVTCINNSSWSFPAVPTGTPIAFPAFTKSFGYDGTSSLIVDISKKSCLPVNTYWAIASNANGARAYGNPSTNPNIVGVTFSYLYQCVVDFRTEKSMAQSLWYRTESNDPTYLETIIQPTEQPPGTETIVVFQGAMDDGFGQADPGTATAWSGNIGDLDGYQYLRFQATFTANLSTGVGPSLSDIVIPYIFF